MQPTARSTRRWEIALQTFSPREIQSRVRAGASAEAVADETGWPLDKVLRYAEPLLAERAFIAEKAQAVEVRRSGGVVTLRQTAAAALKLPADSPSIVWDAWRREDGKWVVAATYPEKGKQRRAEWTYDHAGRNIHPLDDHARALMGVRGIAEDRDAIADALDLVSDLVVDDEPVVESRPRLVAVPDADPIDDGLDETLTVSIPHPSFDDAGRHDADDDDVEVENLEAPAATPAAKPSGRRPKAPRKGRASVPSWDEILFGATRPDDKP